MELFFFFLNVLCDFSFLPDSLHGPFLLLSKNNQGKITCSVNKTLQDCDWLNLGHVPIYAPISAAKARES